MIITYHNTRRGLMILLHRCNEDYPEGIDGIDGDIVAGEILAEASDDIKHAKILIDEINAQMKPQIPSECCDRCGNPFVEGVVYYIRVGDLPGKKLCDACHDSHAEMMMTRDFDIHDEDAVMAARVRWFNADSH